jgi:hypothetical protein
MLNCAYSLSMIMEFVAFVKLRITDDDGELAVVFRLSILASRPQVLFFTAVERPYKIPLNTVGCILFVIPPIGFLTYVLLIASKLTFIYLLALLIIGSIFHLMQKLAHHYHWWEYVEAPKRKRNVKAGVTIRTIPSFGEK